MTTLEDVFTSVSLGFGVVTAMPLQRAICRVIEGLPLEELAEDADVVKGLGGADAVAIVAAGGVRPLEVDILAAIRTAKTRLACAIAWRATQIVGVSALASGEVPRFSFMSLKVDAAHAAYDQLVGTVLANKAMKALLLEEPTNDTLVVRHPSGRPIEIVCVAGSRAGGGLVARWSAGALFDEYTRMVGSEDGATINYDDARRAVLGRLLPNAQIISTGSPWAPFGPAYERCQERHGKPTAEHVVIRGTGPMLNPYWWTPARCERLEKSDLVAYTTDVLNEFADPESSFIPLVEVKRATRATPAVLPPMGNRAYVAAIDPGTRGNSWPLIILAGYRDADEVARFEVALAKQWTGSSVAPLSPALVFREIAKLVRPYGITRIFTDQHAADANADLAAREGLELRIVTVGGGVTRPMAATSQGVRDAHANRNELFERMGGLFAENSLQLSPDPVLGRDVASIRRRLTATGVTYHLPKTADGRHADFVPALCLAILGFPDTAQARAAANYDSRVRRFVDDMALMGYSTTEHREAVQWERAGRRSVWQAVAAARESAGDERLNPAVESAMRFAASRLNA